MIALYIFAYLWFGFIATISPLGQRAYDEHLPPLVFMLFWPVAGATSLIIMACTCVNNWLEKIIR